MPFLIDSRTGSLEVPQRRSPVTPRTTKTPGSEPDSISSPNMAKRTPKNRSPKVIERRSPQSPVPEVFFLRTCSLVNYGRFSSVASYHTWNS